MIEYISAIGAVPVLAHPYLSLKETDALRRFLGPAKEAGLRGMEVLYPLFDDEKTRLAGKLAKEFGLLPSGGSDFHGENKPDIRLGSGKGTLKVPLSFLEGLKTAIDKV
jgi:predicted metal-dependent phosphoesterase TrpH